jgi:acyl-CoA thioesterase II
MTSRLDEVVALLDIAEVGEGAFVGQQAASAPTTGHVFGGLVAGQATVAACRTVEAGRPIHSLHAYFLRRGNPLSPIEFRVEITRDGRAFSHRRVSAIQGGRAIMEMACSFATPERGLAHQMSMPEVIAPEQLRSDWEYLREIPGTVEPVTIPGPIDIRSAEPHSRISRDRGETTDRSRMWMRADGELPDDPVVHTAVLVYSSDLTVLDPVTRPHAMSVVASDVSPSTIDHALWIHGPIRADEWWLCDADSTWAGDGRGFVRGRVFDRAGRLVAQIAQEGLIRLPPEG